LSPHRGTHADQARPAARVAVPGAHHRQRSRRGDDVYRGRDLPRPVGALPRPGGQSRADDGCSGGHRLTVRVERVTERSLVLVKPDGFARRLTGEVIRRIETKGYALVALRILTPTREMLAEHYAEHEGKPFFEPLLEF